MIPISFLKASDHLVTNRKLEIDVDGDYVNSSVMKTNLVKLEMVVVCVGKNLFHDVLMKQGRKIERFPGIPEVIFIWEILAKRSQWYC